MRRIALLGMLVSIMASASCAHAEREVPASEAACAVASGVARQPNLVVRPSTRISVATHLDPALVPHLEYQYAFTQTRYYERRTTSPIFRWLRARLAEPSIFGSPDQIEASSDNILITQTIGLRENGEPYFVRLVARQGDRVWCGSVERPGLLVNATGAGVGPENRMQDGSIYYDPALDIQRLTDALISNLRIGDDDGDQRRR